MAIQYSGGPNINYQFLGDTKAHIITAVQTQLTNANWTVVSGGGTTDVTMQSVATPQGLQMRVRFFDSGGTQVTFQVKNIAGTKGHTGTTGFPIVPDAGDQYRIICNPYQFFMFNVSSIYNGGRYVAFGTPWIPGFLTSGVVFDCIWGHCNSQATTNFSLQKAFRNLTYCSGNNAQYSMCNSIEWIADNTGANNGNQRLVAFGKSNFLTTDVKWWDGRVNIYEPFIGWGISSISDTNLRIFGMLWDAALVSTALQADQSVFFDTRNWWVVTDQNTGASYTTSGSGGGHPAASLVLVIP